jgi:hypothetical protein
LGFSAIALTGRLADFRRLEQVVEASVDVLPEHAATVRVLFATRPHGHLICVC